MSSRIPAALLGVICVLGARPLHAQTEPAPKAAAAEPAEPSSPPPPPPGPSTKELQDQLVTQQVGISEHEARLKALEGELVKLRAASEENKRSLEAKKAEPPPAPVYPEWLETFRSLKFTGYLQAEYQRFQDSEDQLRPDGLPINRDQFLIRRARIGATREWQYASVFVQLEAAPFGTQSFGVNRAEASVHYRGAGEKTPLPLVGLASGLLMVPFGRELVVSARNRAFMERSQFSRAFFPTERDVGAKLYGQLGWFRYDLAVLNGEVLNTPNGFALHDPNSNKDLVLRLAAHTKPAEVVTLNAGVSILNGKGFRRGADATKPALAWRDKNDDALVQVNSGEVEGTAGLPVTPSYNFDRWMVGTDLELGLRLTTLGVTKLYGEFVLGSNMDRALYIAAPVPGELDTRELGYFVAVVQDLTPYAHVGFRFDYYNPNADLVGFKSGKQVPNPQTIRTYSPLIGIAMPGQAKLVFQYDFVRDHLARNPQGLPADLKNDGWTLRLQGEL